ncbi:MAG: EamA family transporter, partial [Candidatus Kapaibacteriota bacterium]
DVGSLTGNMIAVASGVAFAGVALFMRAQRGTSTTESILLGNVLTAVVCLPFLSPFPLTLPVMANLLALGVLQLGVSYLLYSWALKHVSALEAILLTTLEPLLNPVWVTLFHGETPSVLSMVGGSIVVGAVVLRNVLNSSRLQPQASNR